MSTNSAKIDLTNGEQIVSSYRGKQIVLIPLLQEIQAHYGYVPREMVGIIAKEFGIPPSDIYGVLTFYAQFYLEPRGKYVVKVCQGTACYILGGKEILDHVADSLRIQPDETTEDGLFTLETVACLGCCGMGPVVAINQQLYGNCTVAGVSAMIKECRERK